MVADQALLSGLSLALSVTFIYFGTKPEFGLYALVVSALFLALGAQNAVLITPFIVNAAPMNRIERARFRRQLVRLQVPLSLSVGCVVGGAALLMKVEGASSGAGLFWAAVTAVVGGWLREFRRGEHILLRRYGTLFAGDLAMVAIAMCLVYLVVLTRGRMEAWTALLCLGLASTVTGTGPLWASMGGAGGEGGNALSWRTLVDQVRWTLPGMALAWLQVTAYPYFVALTAGPGAVAETAAARLIINPGLVVNTAFAKFLLPHMGEINLVRGPVGARAEARRLLRPVAAASLTYVAGVAAFLALGGERLLPQNYRGAAPIAIAWTVVLLATCVRTVPSITLQALARFRPLLTQGAMAALVAAGACVGLGAVWQATGCVAGVACGEMLLGGLLWRRLRIISNGDADETEPNVVRATGGISVSG